jgi:hypothetical protein
MSLISPISRVPIPFGILTLLFAKLNLAQLPTDLTAFRYYALDLTAQIHPSSCALLRLLPGCENQRSRFYRLIQWPMLLLLSFALFLPALGRISKSQRPRPLLLSFYELLDLSFVDHKSAVPPELLFKSLKISTLPPAESLQCTCCSS